MAKKKSVLIEYVTEEEHAEQSKQDADTGGRSHSLDEWADRMADLAQANPSHLRVPRNANFSRANIVQAFTDAFEIIGGVPRLALWAHENETDFYKLYGKLLPSQSAQLVGEESQTVIRHVLPRGELDK